MVEMKFRVAVLNLSLMEHGLESWYFMVWLTIKELNLEEIVPIVYVILYEINYQFL